MKKAIPFLARLGLVFLGAVSTGEMCFGALSDVYSTTTALSNRLIAPEESYDATIEALS